MVGRMPATLTAVTSASSRDRRVPLLFVGLCGDAPRLPPARIGLDGIDRVEIGRGDARTVARRAEAGGTLVALSLVDARMSKQHARLTRRGDTWILEDLNSKNGTWVARNRITAPSPLADGDAFIVGHTALVIRYASEAGTDLDGFPQAPAPGLA